MDILSGIAVLLIGVAWHFDLVPIGAVVPVIVTPFWKPLRMWIAAPWLGQVEFSDDQTTRNRFFLNWSFLLGCLAFVFATASYVYIVKTQRVVPWEDWVAAIPAWAFAVLALLASMSILVRRFIIYACLFLLLGILVVVLDQKPEVAMLVGGTIVTAVGALRLLVFVRSHPQHPIELNGA